MRLQEWAALHPPRRSRKRAAPRAGGGGNSPPGSGKSRCGCSEAVPDSEVEGTTRREEEEAWGDKHQESEARPRRSLSEGSGKPLRGGGGGGGVGEGPYDNLGVV